MKKLVVIGSLLAVSACTPAAQKTVKTVKDVVECKLEVLSPHVDKLTSDEFMAALADKDYFDALSVAGVSPEAAQQLVEDLKACHKQ